MRNLSSYLFVIICFTFIVFVEINIADGVALFLGKAVEFFQSLRFVEAAKPSG